MGLSLQCIQKRNSEREKEGYRYFPRRMAGRGWDERSNFGVSYLEAWTSLHIFILRLLVLQIVDFHFKT